jgi:hypothetical protein
VAVRASSDDDRGGVVPGRRLVSFPQGREPVLAAPAAGVRRVDGDHRQPRVGDHLDQPVAELAGRDAEDRAPEPASPLAA